jgi:hypothetical protein
MRKAELGSVLACHSESEKVGSSKRKFGRREILKKAGLLGAAGTLAVANSAALKADYTQDVGDRGHAPLGVWLVKVISITYPGAEYSYFYSFARGGYTATGNIDENFEGQKYSPTMGVYDRTGNESVRYREKGWIFDLEGNNIGISDAVGTFPLDSSCARISGPGVYTQYDLSGNVIFTEEYTVEGTKVAV